MKYTVIWFPSEAVKKSRGRGFQPLRLNAAAGSPCHDFRSAENELAMLWMESQDREAVTLSANEVDRRLRFNPRQQGESRSHGRRIAVVPPLGVVYRVNDDDRLVHVLHVWRFQP